MVSYMWRRQMLNPPNPKNLESRGLTDAHMVQYALNKKDFRD